MLTFIAAAAAALAMTSVHFPSLSSEAQPPTLPAYLVQAPGDAKHPAIILLHGCGGWPDGQPDARLIDWARRLNGAGYAILMMDSFTPRAINKMCTANETQIDEIYPKRVGDVRGALAFLATQRNVDTSRVGLIGWSQGGGTVLRVVAQPVNLRAAVAFYPGCSIRRLGKGWHPQFPLLLLQGEADVWTRAAPCNALVKRTASSNITYHTYPDAYHDFDWPNLPVRPLPQFKTSTGTIPITGMNLTARNDAIGRVTVFFERRLTP